jgi:hypothetical protein
LGLWAEADISGKFGKMSIRMGWDIEHAVINGLNFALAEKTKMGSDGFIKIMGFCGLGRVKK